MSKERGSQGQKPKDDALNPMVQELQNRWRMAGLSPVDIAAQTARFLQGEQQRATDPFHQAATPLQPQDPLEGLQLSRGVKGYLEKARAQGVEEDDLQARLGAAAFATEGAGRKKITMKRLRSATR